MKAINTNSKSTLDKASRRLAVQFGVGRSNIESPTPGKAEGKNVEPYIVCVCANIKSNILYILFEKQLNKSKAVKQQTDILCWFDWKTPHF